MISKQQKHTNVTMQFRQNKTSCLGFNKILHLFTKAKYHESVVKENRNEITVNKNTISRYITSMAEFQQSKQ